LPNRAFSESEEREREIESESFRERSLHLFTTRDKERKIAREIRSAALMTILNFSN
jgi:hypothetical protein